MLPPAGVLLACVRLIRRLLEPIELSRIAGNIEAGFYHQGIDRQKRVRNQNSVPLFNIHCQGCTGQNFFYRGFQIFRSAFIV